jgi:hypothetical protein
MSVTSIFSGHSLREGLAKPNRSIMKPLIYDSPGDLWRQVAAFLTLMFVTEPTLSNRGVNRKADPKCDAEELRRLRFSDDLWAKKIPITGRIVVKPRGLATHRSIRRCFRRNCPVSSESIGAA